MLVTAFKSYISFPCFGNFKLSTTHTLFILNGYGYEGDETENDTNLDLIWFDKDIKFNKMLLLLSAKHLEIILKSDPEFEYATAQTRNVPREVITWSN